MKTKKSAKVQADEFSLGYQQIMNSSINSHVKQEWAKLGDKFEKLTNYKVYEPVRTSNNTNK